MKLYVDLPDFTDNYEELISYLTNANPAGFIRSIVEDINQLRNATIDYVRDSRNHMPRSNMVDYVIRSATDHVAGRLSSGAMKVITRVCLDLFNTVLRRMARGYDWYNYCFYLDSHNYGSVRTYGTVSLLLCCTRITEFPDELEPDFTKVSRLVVKAMFGVS